MEHNTDIVYTARNVPGSDFFHMFLKKAIKERLEISKNIIDKYPDRIPVLVDKACGSLLPDISKNKFLVPRDISFDKILPQIRRHLSVTSEQAIFLFVNNSLPPSPELMGNIYNIHKNEDNFLYITYAAENVFG
jgi:GABA(A) receptor-associated protein